MKSPCHDCENSDTDKNNSICTECDKRVKYAQGLNACLDSSIKIERRVRVVGYSYGRGTCKNCERPDMSLQGLDLCWLCKQTHLSATTEEGRIAALAEVKAKIKAGARGQKSKRRLAAAQPDKIKICTIPEDRAPSSVDSPLSPDKRAETPDHLVTHKTGVAASMTAVDVVCIEFKGARDEKMLDWINELAEEHRRNTEQEIMWIIQDYINTADKLTA